MAGLFQAFRTSAMPKRLLRYALAKFDIFEDDALDLENLDLGFGFKNTFEFKDIGLKVDVRTHVLLFCSASPCSAPLGPSSPSLTSYAPSETHKAARPTR